MLDGLITSGFAIDLVSVAIVTGVLFEARLLVGSALNVQFVLEHDINGLKRLSAISTMRKKFFKIIAMLLILKSQSAFGQMAALVLVIDGIFSWRDLVYYTHLIKHEA